MAPTLEKDELGAPVLVPSSPRSAENVKAASRPEGVKKRPRRPKRPSSPIATGDGRMERELAEMSANNSSSTMVDGQLPVAWAPWSFLQENSRPSQAEAQTVEKNDARRNGHPSQLVTKAPKQINEQRK
jgi:hypothetical protein